MGNLAKFPEDMSIMEKESLRDYIDNGCPGLIETTEGDVFKWFRLYMSGKSYSEIAQLTKRSKDLILYISHKSSWNSKRMEHYNSLISQLRTKTTQAQLDSTNTVISMIAALNKYYGGKFDDYLSKNDPSIIEQIDTKLLSQYHKSLESLDKMITPSKSKDKKEPPININLFPSSKPEDSDGEPKVVTESQAGDILTILAEYKRKKEEDTE